MTGPKPHLIETVFIVKGTVQGVFFRATTKRHADNLKLKGYVRNLNDGSVEICITDGDADKLISFLQKESHPIKISSVNKVIRPQTKNYKNFFIY